jgi:hypothetical protein
VNDGGRDTMDDGGRLREAFARLRAEEHRAAPSFDHIMNRRQARKPAAPRRARALGLAGAVAMILFLAVAGPRLGRLLTPDRQVGNLAMELQRTSTIWRSPTDFLLEPSQARSWRRIPTIARPARPTVPDNPALRGRTDDIDMEHPGRTPS